MSLPNPDTDRPTWKAVSDRSREILTGMLELGVLLMPASDETDNEVELNVDDADDVLGQLSDAWTAIYPSTSLPFVDLALAVWKREMTVEDAIGF